MPSFTKVVEIGVDVMVGRPVVMLRFAVAELAAKLSPSLRLAVIVTFPVFLMVTNPALVTVAIEAFPDVYVNAPFELVVGLVNDNNPLKTNEASGMTKFVIEGVALLMVKTVEKEPATKSPDAD